MITQSRIAYEDLEFLDSDEGRPIRIQAEYLKPLRTFRQARIEDTIVFFGSARLQPDGPLGHYYEAARDLAYRVTEWSRSQGEAQHRFVVCTGGGGGIMEAANRGASEAGGPTIGLNIGLPHEQRPNEWITPDLALEFRYFFMRKLWFAHLARAMIAFPGGFGTLDELFEILTLAQTRKLSAPIQVLLYGSEYWQEVVDLPALARHGMISHDDLQLFRYVDTPEEAMAALKAELHEEIGRPAPDIARSLSSDPDA